MIRTKSVQQSILMSLISLTIILIVTISFFTKQTASEIIIEEAQKTLDNRVKEFSDKTDTYLNNYKAILEVLAKSEIVADILETHRYEDFKNRSLDPRWQLVRKQIMLPFQKQFDESIALLYFGSELHGENYRHNDTAYVNYDARQRAWYRSAVQSNGFAFSSYLSHDKTKIDVTISTPIYRNSKLLGVVGVDIKTDYIFKGLSESLSDSNYMPMVLDLDGRILYHPKSSLLLKTISDTTVSFSESFVAAVRMMQDKQTGIVEFDTVNDEQFKMSFRPIRSSGWIIGLGVNQQLLNEPINDLLISILTIDLVILVIAVILVMFSLSRFRQLLGHYVQSLKNVAAGKSLMKDEFVIDSNDEVAEMAKWFDDFSHSIELIMNKFKETGQNILEISTQLSESANQLNAATVQQSSAVAETTTAMEEMYKTSSNISENADKVADAAMANQDFARAGVDQLNDFIDKIEKIEKQAESHARDILQLNKKISRINEVMGLIRRINEQTKLIAFNAALEASGAGESGKRFYVVANEIRRLADTVQESMEEIKLMTDEIHDQTQLLMKTTDESNAAVRLGVEASRDVTVRFNRIHEGTTAVTTASQQINVATGQQKTASEQIVSTLHEIKDAVSNVVNMAKEVNVITRQLKMISEDFKSISVDDFKKSIKGNF